MTQVDLRHIPGCTHVVTLPEGYTAPGLRLIQIDHDKVAVTHPEQPVLFINIQSGEVKEASVDERSTLPIQAFF